MEIRLLLKYRMSDENSVVIVDLDYICETIRVAPQRRTEILSMLKRWYAPGVRSFSSCGTGRGNKVKAAVEKPYADEFIRVFLAKRKEFTNNKTVAGVVYCFVGMCGQLVDGEYKHMVKAGKATVWKRRKRKFRGVSAIRNEIAIRPTSNRHVAEVAVLKMMRARFPSAGGEWFLIGDGQLADLKRHFLALAVPTRTP